MKITPTFLMGLILISSPLQAADFNFGDTSDSEQSLTAGTSPFGYHSFSNAELRIPINGSSEDLGLDDTSTPEKVPYEKENSFISLVPHYRPAEMLEKNIDYYVLQPLLYAGGSTTLAGGLVTLYSNLDTGILTMGIGFGITAGALGLKTIVRLSAGAIELYRHCRRQAKNENNCC